MSGLRARVYGVLIGSSVVIASLAGQQAQQGVLDPTNGGTVFRSPMVLSARLAAVDRSLWDKGWFSVDEYRELGKFTCDGVSIRNPSTGLRRGPWKSGLEMQVKTKQSGMVEVIVRLRVYNPADNHDKTVSVVVDLLSGANAVHTATVGPMKVEDKGTGKEGQTSFLIPAAFLSGRPEPTLRLTVTARDI